MNDPAVTPIPKSTVDHASTPKRTERQLDEEGAKEAPKPSARNKNRLVAERSADMYLGGLMCE
jgi:hypothetical protein